MKKEKRIVKIPDKHLHVTRAAGDTSVSGTQFTVATSAVPSVVPSGTATSAGSGGTARTEYSDWTQEHPGGEEGVSASQVHAARTAGLSPHDPSIPMHQASTKMQTATRGYISRRAGERAGEMQSRQALREKATELRSKESKCEELMEGVQATEKAANELVQRYEQAIRDDEHVPADNSRIRQELGQLQATELRLRAKHKEALKEVEALTRELEIMTANAETCWNCVEENTGTLGRLAQDYNEQLARLNEVLAAKQTRHSSPSGGAVALQPAPQPAVAPAGGIDGE